MYKKIGAWVNWNNISEIQDVFDTLAREKGFILDTLDSDTALTLEFLRRYQAVIWNNNSNSGASMPSPAARKAMTDYVEQGGGWMLLTLAGDTYRSWPALDSMLGTSITSYGDQIWAHILADSSAKKHPELKHVVSAIPDTIRLFGVWLAYRNTVRALPGVTVLYTNGMAEQYSLDPYADRTTDRTYIWAREVGAGKLLYNGYWYNRMPDEGDRLMHVAGGAIANMYWQSLRWLAGDFKNGCTDPSSPRFDPEARIDDSSCSGTGVRPDPREHGGILAVHGRAVRLAFRADRETGFALRNVHGALVGRLRLSPSMDEVRLGDAVPAGIYFLEARTLGKIARYRLLVP